MQEMQVQSPGWEVPLENGMATTPVFLPGEFHGQRNLAGYSPWGRKESDTTERLTLSVPQGIKIHMLRGVPKTTARDGPQKRIA